jgi:hypothetical protein
VIVLPAASLVLALAAMPFNHLAGESSPYLLQHQHNPVDWYPWGDAAFEKAKHEDKPVFLSIGYSTCHWCHVMERESFESTEIAALLNRDFVSIKVDREERPDIDNVYMTACQMMTCSGGWPLTVILTPDGRPFFSGTYFPPDDRQGRIGMRSLLPRLAAAWKSQRKELEEQATHVATAVEEAIQAPPSSKPAAPLDAAFSDQLLADLERRFDERHGGFSSAPKFPPHGALQFLVDRARSKAGGSVDRMLRRTLDEMQSGGIFDQVGGGFHRYSVDEEWFIPHFEKMLYDNAQLLEIYAAASRIYRDSTYSQTARRIVDWLEREMRTPEGAYASALDADSEGVEGKYYLWKAGEVDEILGASDAGPFRETFDVRDSGNTPPYFEEGHGKNLPRRVKPAEPGLTSRFTADLQKLESVRARRVPPGRDDKVLTSWNALAISALSHASRDLDDPELSRIAKRIADYLLSRHAAGAGLLHVSRGGQAKIGGFLDDYAYFARSLLDLSEQTGEKAYELRARELAAVIAREFPDEKLGGFYQTAATGKRSLLDSSKEFLDQVTPSPNGVAVEVLGRLDALRSEPAFRRAAASALAAAAGYARTFPSGAATLAILAERNRESAPAAVSASNFRSGPVAVSAICKPATLHPGEEAQLIVQFEIEPGWHVQSHSPSREELVATEVRIPRNSRVAAGEVSYPAGEEIEVGGEKLRVYSGGKRIMIPVSVAGNAAAGDVSIPLEVVYQPCDDRRCLAPVRTDLAVGLKIEPRLDR